MAHGDATAGLPWENPDLLFELLDADKSGAVTIEELEAKILQYGYSSEVAHFLMRGCV